MAHNRWGQLRQVYRFLFCAAQGLDGHLAAGHFVLTPDQGERGTALVRFLELAFEAAASRVLDEADAGHLVAQRLDLSERSLEGSLPRTDNIDVNIAAATTANAHCLQQQHQAFHAHREAHRRRAAATQLLNQTVVTPTCTDGSLRAQLIGDPLKYGLVVVVQPPNQAWIDREINAGGFQQSTQLIKIFPRLIVKVIRQLRGTIQQGLGLGVLAIEDTQRVAVQSTLAVIVQVVPMLLEIAYECIAVGTPRIQATDRV